MDGIRGSRPGLGFASKTHRPMHIEIICFLCQQAAEKALKAILAYHDEDIPRTHDLIKVLKFCEPHCPGIKDRFAEQAGRLSNFAVTARYPTEVGVSEKEMDQAIENAGQILSAVKSLW